jgi:WhiB family redox-sensing transcriptional regulator
MHRAYCRGANPEIFEDSGHVETALEYCRRCLVHVYCLEYALSLTPHPEGVWGGTTEEDRRRLRRGGYRVTCPGCLGVRVYTDGVTEACLNCGLAWKT